jgi:hypothetical protein
MYAAGFGVVWETAFDGPLSRPTVLITLTVKK